ncbi:MAG: type VI secretion system tip protein VgrG [Labilithrix sp.]|nr:type VI secretion system tip protein VgrG [Labilithrix sp.]
MSHDHLVEVTLQIDGVDGTLLPTSVRVDEALHASRTIAVTIAGETLGVGASTLLRKGAQLDVSVGGEAARRFEGIVLRVKESWSAAGAPVVVTLGSPLDLLALSTDCRIFQEMSVPDIVVQVLKDAGLPPARIVKRLAGSYPKLESCTQYGETMLAFVSRILEADGAYLFLEDGDDGLLVVLGDSIEAHRTLRPAQLPFVVDAGVLTKPAITSLTEVEALRASKVTLRDLDWTKPNLDLEASSAEAATARARELYDHPGGHVTPEAGKARARGRIEALVAAASGVTGVANVPGLAPGKTFELEDAPRTDLSQDWLVVQVTHLWDAGGDASQAWRSSFRAVPKNVPWRPLAATPKPRIAGPQTAFVTGPSGQEIHTDEHGRVRLKFHWDRRAAFDEKSSPWVRVAELAMSGAVAVPRVGWEVLVEFEHGDPDRPVVVGRLYNATYLPPYPLPAKKTVSSLMSFSSPDGAGHNEIRIEDAAGSEHIHLHAQRNLVLDVARERRTHVTTSRMVTIQKDEEVTVKGNRSLDVKGLWEVTVAGSQTLAVDGERKKTVKKDEKITVNGDRKTTIAGSHVVSTEASATLGAGGDVSSTIAGTLTEESTDDATSIVVGDDMSVTVGGPKTETVKKGKSATVDGKRSITVGGAQVDVSGKDLGVLVGGKRTSTVGAAWTVTSAADIELSSRDALEITVGGALTVTGASGIAFKVGSSKVLIGQGGVVIETSKLKIASDGPSALLGALVGSK